MKFTEAQLETAIIELLGAEGYPHVLGEAIDLSACDAQAGRQPQEVLIKDDLRVFLARQYAKDGGLYSFIHINGSLGEFALPCVSELLGRATPPAEPSLLFSGLPDDRTF